MKEIAQEIPHEEIGRFIPHRGKMALLGRIVSHDAENWTIASETKIESDCPFLGADGSLPSLWLFELAAQTVSALTGIWNELHGKPKAGGVILSVSQTEFSSDTVRAGTAVTVRAAREADMGSINTFRAEFLVEGAPFGSGKLTVMTEGGA